MLQSVKMPASVVGGNNLAGTYNLTGPPTNQLQVQFVPGGPSVLKGTSSVQNSTQGAFSLPTVGVDIPTLLNIDAIYGWGVVVHSSTKVMPAAIATFQPSAASVQGGQPVSFSVQYNGDTGPSGKAITVSSGDATIIPSQGPFYVGPQKTSASGLQFLTNKVTAAKSITVLVSDGYSHRTATVTVTP